MKPISFKQEYVLYQIYGFPANYVFALSNALSDSGSYAIIENQFTNGDERTKSFVIKVRPEYAYKVEEVFHNFVEEKLPDEKIYDDFIQDLGVTLFTHLIVKNAIEALSDRDYMVICDYYGIWRDKVPLKKIGMKIGVTAEEAKQIKNDAMNELKGKIATFTMAPIPK